MLKNLSDVQRCTECQHVSKGREEGMEGEKEAKGKAVGLGDQTANGQRHCQNFWL